MSKEIDNKNELPSCIKSDQVLQEEAIKRCFFIFDFISNTAGDIITNMIDNNPCPEAKSFLLNRPEEVAVMAFKKVIDDLEHMGCISKNYQ